MLQSQPVAFGQTEVTIQSQSRVRCHGPFSTQNRGNPRKRHTDPLGQAIGCETRRIEKFIAQKDSRVRKSQLHGSTARALILKKAVEPAEYAGQMKKSLNFETRAKNPVSLLFKWECFA